MKRSLATFAFYSLYLGGCSDSGGEIRVYHSGFSCKADHIDVSLQIAVYNVIEKGDKSHGGVTEIKKQKVVCIAKKDDLNIAYSSAETSDWLGDCNLTGDDGLIFHMTFSHESMKAEFTITNQGGSVDNTSSDCEEFEDLVSSYT